MPSVGRFRQIERAAIKIGDRFRKDYKDIDDLAASIKKRLFYPIKLDTDFNLIDGGRRLAAMDLLKWPKIPCFISPIEEEVDIRELELLCNLERESFTWSETANLIKEIHQIHKKSKVKWGIRDTATRIGMSKSYVANQIKLADLLLDIPELSVCKSESDAWKLINSIEEALALKEYAKRKAKADLKKPAPKPVVGMPNASHSVAASHRYIGKQEFIVGDFFKEAAKLPDNHWGKSCIVECDPPYGIELNTAKKGEDKLKEYKEVSREDYPEFLLQLMYECSRLMGGNSCLIFWFGIEWYDLVLRSLSDAGFRYNKIPTLWYKVNFSGQANAPKKMLSNQYETFIHAWKGDAFLGRPGSGNVFLGAAVPPSIKTHPTEKSVALYEDIFRNICDLKIMHNMVVPFAGSGSSLIAAQRLNISAIGYDLSEYNYNNWLLRRENGK